MSRRKMKIIAVIFLLATTYMIYLRFEIDNSLNQPLFITQSIHHSVIMNRSQPKFILVWNDLHGFKNWRFSKDSRDDLKQLGCKECNCIVTDDRLKLSEASAVLFHADGKMTSIPAYKIMNQRWVFVMHEAPSKYPPGYFKAWNSLFNWTQTYRLDSDIPMPYRHTCKPRVIWQKLDYPEILKRKTRLCAWMVSNCKSNSHREEYVTELLKHMQVDVFGACSANFQQYNTCNRDQEESCMRLLDEKYKFYLSFENSLSRDYISEKFVKILNLNTVPVVRGVGNYTALGPENSFIDSRDFKSPKQLAEFLLYLDKNDDRYIEYIQWKERFHSNNCGPGDYLKIAFCELCRKLHDSNEPVRVYENIDDWYHDW